MARHKYTKDEQLRYYNEHCQTFYFNPDDSNITVPKVSGLGYSLNFAHPLSYVILGLILGVVIASLIFSRS
jgi:uncharacterized membrane protein